MTSPWHDTECHITDFYQLSHLWVKKCYRLNHDVDFTIFKDEELENDEIIHGELACDLESDL